MRTLAVPTTSSKKGAPIATGKLQTRETSERDRKEKEERPKRTGETKQETCSTKRNSRAALRKISACFICKKAAFWAALFNFTISVRLFHISLLEAMGYP